VNLLEEYEDFGCDEMEHKNKPRTTSTWLRPNEAIINLFTLQHIKEETTNDEEHQMEDEKEN
jgi:hypothetical protein